MKLIFFFIFLHASCIAQDINQVIREADRLEAIPDEKGAFVIFKEALRLQPSNIHALTKCSELCSRIGAREKNTKSRDDYYKAAVSYASTALRFHPNNDEANVVMAIAVGRTLLVKSGKEKISGVKEIKQYADNAIRINEKNFKAWHVLGKWNYEVSNLNFFERAATKLLYGGLPEASLDKSITSYERARNLNPAFILNYLELAKAYYRKDDKKRALTNLNMVLKLPGKTEDDPRIKNEARKLLSEWQ